MEDDQLEDEICCGKCGQYWFVETHKKGFVTALAMLTGYTCKECAGEDPMRWADSTKTPFPARKSFRRDEEEE